MVGTQASNGNSSMGVTYDAFGNITSTKTTTPFGYRGEYKDSETGYIYLRNRYYDPDKGRFISEDSYWNPYNMIDGGNKNSIPDITAIMQSNNLYAYCGNNPINRHDYSGNNWVTDEIKNGWNKATNVVDEAQKTVQRNFWALGAQEFLREEKGYLTSAWMLEHSLQDNPSDILRGNDSRIAYLINNDSAYLSQLDKAIKSSTNGTVNQYLKDVAFNDGDLYYSIHRSTIHIEGYKQNNGSWIIHATMTDTYDFTEIQTFMGDGGWSMQAGLGTVANDVAVISQATGAISPYDVTVEFYTTRWTR